MTTRLVLIPVVINFRTFPSMACRAPLLFSSIFVCAYIPDSDDEILEEKEEEEVKKFKGEKESSSAGNVAFFFSE